jgi:putative flippase GtrA
MHILKSIQKFSDRTFIRWFIVGITSLFIDIGGFAIGLEISTSILIANLIAAILSTSFNYLAHYFWTFDSKGRHSGTILRYYLNIFFLWIGSSLLIQLLTLNSFEPLVAKVLSLVLILPLNFLTLKFFVYKETRD